MGNTTKIIIAVVLFVVAGVLFIKFQSGGETSRLADGAKETWVFVCTDCGEHFEMSREEGVAALEAAPVRENPNKPGGQQTRASLRRQVLPKLIACQKCGTEAAVRAKKCEDGAYVPMIKPDGTKGECP